MVGLVNTVIDTTIFVVLHTAGVALVLANLCSTSIALVVSFFLNYRFTFRSQTITHKRKVLYFGVTIVGLWLLQPIVIKLILDYNNQSHFTNFAVKHLHHAAALNNLIAKLMATVVTLVWNYLWYSQVVFKEKSVSPSR
jgi:putative flippase GtrA